MYLSKLAKELDVDETTALRILIRIWRKKAKEGGDVSSQK